MHRRFRHRCAVETRRANSKDLIPLFPFFLALSVGATGGVPIATRSLASPGLTATTKRRFHLFICFFVGARD